MRYTLTLLSLLLLACSHSSDPIDDIPEQPTPPRLTSIVCATETYAITRGGVIEVMFKVEEPEAHFIYATTAEGCDVELRLAHDTATKPTELDIVEVRKDDATPGVYYAKIADNNTLNEYYLELRIAITTTDNTIYSNTLRIARTNEPERTGSITSVSLPKSNNPALEADILFDYDATTMTFSAYVDDYISDRTLLRNRVAHFLASQTSLAWTPRCEFVELMLNGRHLGQYLLTEQVRVDNDRIDITEMTATDNAGEAITGGYLLELDFHFDNQWQWHSNRNIPFAVKYPDEEDLTTEQFDWIRGHIAEVEAVLYGSNYADKDGGYNRYIDAQSFVDYWLIYELCVNHELANPGSVYLTKDRGGKLTAGPIWDFDWGTFSFQASPAAASRLFMTHAWWYGRLFSDDSFKALATERWQVLKPKFMEVFQFIDKEREYIRRSWSKNFAFWSITTNTNGDETLGFDEAVDRVKDVLRRRIEIIDSQLEW